MNRAAPDPRVAVIFDRTAAPGATSLAEFEADPDRFLADASGPLSEIMEREWEHDAHLAMYRAEDDAGAPAFLRINKRGSSFAGDLLAQGGRIVCPVLVFDHDLHDANGNKAEWTEEGLGRFARFLAESDLHLPTYWYTTKHGSRFVYVLTEPVQHREAEGLMLGIMRDWAQAGLELDRACRDWTRLFRLPKVLRDGQRTEAACLFQLLPFGDLLDPAGVRPVDPGLGGADEFADVARYAGTIPDPEECHELLWDISPKTGREARSSWQKLARQYLSGRDSFEYCFDHRVLQETDSFEGKALAGTNDGLVRILGQIVGQLARQAEASPEGVYALMRECVEQLKPTERHPDWHAVAWDITCRMWSNELAQIEAEHRAREEGAAEGAATRDELLDTYRSKLPGTVPDEPEAAQEWLRGRLIASDGSKHHIMMRDGTYSVCAFGDSMLIPAIRDLSMEDVIEIHEMRGKSWVEKSPRSILNGQAIPISRVVCSSAEAVASITGDAGYRTLTIPVHQLDPHRVPAFSNEVDAWLKRFFGEMYERGVEWLSHCLDVTRSICALNLYGASGAGKDMLVEGIAECFRFKSKADGNKAISRFNDCLLDSPVVHFNEGVPTGNLPGCNTTDQTFRALVTGGDIAVEGKGQRVVTAQVYPRIIFTSNDYDITRAIIGDRDLSDDDINAIEVRLLNVAVPQSAVRYLTDLGNLRHTAGWIKGNTPSHYTLAQHILYLFEHREPARGGSGRLLVEGQAGTSLMQDMRMSTNVASAVVRTTCKMIEDAPRGAVLEGLHISEGRVWVLPYGIQKAYEKHLQDTVRTRLTTRTIAKVLRQLCESAASPTPRALPGQLPGERKQRWWELDLRILTHEAIKHGMPREHMERLVLEVHGVDALAEIHGQIALEEM